jgi:hypothetical protein
MMMMMMIIIISKEDPLIQIVRTNQHNTHSASLQTANKFKKSFQNETKQIKNKITQIVKGKREEKTINRQFPRSLDEKLVDKEQSYRWLKFGVQLDGSSGSGNQYKLL